MKFVVTIKLFNNNKILNFMKKKLRSVREKLLVENHGGQCHCRNFGK